LGWIEAKIMQSHNIGLVSAKIAGHELLEVAVVAFFWIQFCEVSVHVMDPGVHIKSFRR